MGFVYMYILLSVQLHTDIRESVSWSLVLAG